MWKHHKERKLRKSFLLNFKPTTEEEKSVIRFLELNPYCRMPYTWSSIYDKRFVDVKHDADTGLCYAEENNKRLYFPNGYGNHVAQALNSLAREQDIRSPHRYVTEQNIMFGAVQSSSPPVQSAFFVEKEDVVADVGAAEGFFALSVIDIVSHVYLFEPSEKWWKPLENTFKAYSDKVTIVKKSVSDCDTENSVTLDTFFKDKKVTFIKADIEGFERKMFAGGKALFAERDNIKAAICTYHCANDPEDFQKIFTDMGYSTCFSHGFMLEGTRLTRGVIRAERTRP
jgi:hypothetical protein